MSYAPALQWEKPLTRYEDPHYLIGIVNIGGLPFHAEAWEVHDVDEDGQTVQEAMGEHAESADAVIDRVVCGAVQPITIDGKEYCLAITPFER